MVCLFTSLRIGELTISLVALLNLCQQWGLSLWVVSTKLLGALKHQVLQIVSQSCGFGRVVLRTGTYGNISLNTWFLSVHTQVHLQSVIQCVHTGLHHVTRNGNILKILSLSTHTKCHGYDSQ